MPRKRKQKPSNHKLFKAASRKLAAEKAKTRKAQQQLAHQKTRLENEIKRRNDIIESGLTGGKDIRPENWRTQYVIDLDNFKLDPPDYFYRQGVREIIAKLPVNELQKVFVLRVTDSTNPNEGFRGRECKIYEVFLNPEITGGKRSPVPPPSLGCG